MDSPKEVSGGIKRLDCAPLLLEPSQRLSFNRCELYPGVWLQRPTRALMRCLSTSASASDRFHPSHFLLVDIDEYAEGVIRELQHEGKSIHDARQLLFPSSVPDWAGPAVSTTDV